MKKQTNEALKEKQLIRKVSTQVNWQTISTTDNPNT
jgi:hypothetical protein